MYYEINVILNGKHFFATAERSITNKDHLCKVYKALKLRFHPADGYSLHVSYNQHSSVSMNESEFMNES
jgi:hypothetical protein